MATRKTAAPAGSPSFRSFPIELPGEDIRPRLMRAAGSVATDRADGHAETDAALASRARRS
jgi:hypothetical protein